MQVASKLVAVTGGALALWLHPVAAQEGCTNISSTETYDYIVVGSGAGGIPVADRLSEAGHKVLLIEKGPPSTGRWGGIMKPEWLIGTNLTRFDVPGLCNQIWADPTGAICTDVDQMAGCMLGGGTAVNAGLWWKPHPADWDVNFPEGWHSEDMAEATERVFERIPGTITPSMDGKRYLSQGFDMLGGSLEAAGWEYLVPNEHPDRKNRTYGHSTFMYSGGERGGPLATYLVSAVQREGFTLWMNTTVTRIIREGGHATGVEVQCSNSEAGQAGIVPLTPKTGRVIVSAGAFGSAKLLFRSGIGPKDQLNIVKNSTDGPSMISEDQWIELPVGYNLNDHVGTDIEIAHPDVVFYDYYGAWDEPIVEDTERYVANRTGPLAQAAPNIGPIFWETIKGSDGVSRHLQWQARVEGKLNSSRSRGRMTITRRLNTVVSTPPYLRDEYDREAVIQGIANLRESLKGVANLTWITPPSNVTVEDFVDSIPATPARRCSNHWIGNPSAAIVIAAEYAAAKILALPAPEDAAS
ncbi:cellobiose dehydrogenase [Thermothelomyces thermophilus ATCC 42464]|uniref:Cellobiose dehydrogenase n=1 Tax=Thermothelomyces thermophilus (strain ATCC 42464 / BCRC 31852 / DSM 1799) TaxID=573729 RepID=G2QNS9_THET4|nr:cellobiose dehydrogenase [Thermothelomyces thermophilus ATCC 42464]AEO61303.1 cellobiose dehydrogenase [Thermothelomyces thermophilus ATCC 42464]